MSLFRCVYVQRMYKRKTKSFIFLYKKKGKGCIYDYMNDIFYIMCKPVHMKMK